LACFVKITPNKVAPHLSVVTCGRLKIIREFTPICANQKATSPKTAQKLAKIGED
jgi:hypothetical protein